MIYAIGDIHGQHAMLGTLLARLIELPLHSEDTVVFLGDYVDRGEDACAVIETLLPWRDQQPNTVFLRGNHEQLMLDAYGDVPPHADIPNQVVRAQLTLMWLQNGGSASIARPPSPTADGSSEGDQGGVVSLARRSLRS